jgi:methanol metabolism-related c-type cytochrome
VKTSQRAELLRALVRSLIASVRHPNIEEDLVRTIFVIAAIAVAAFVGKTALADGTGYRRYHSECHVCHGPDGMGSTYAPALKDSLKTMSYADFLGVVASGRKNVTSSQENVMPAFGDNPNVSCYMDDIYVYLRARANDTIGRVRPAKHEDKSDAAKKAEDSCMGNR